LVVVVVVVAGCKAFDGGWVGSAMKAQILTVAACAWAGAAAAVVPKECILALAGTPVWAPKAGKTGDDMVAAEP
jgi:hypothetical protein